MEFWNLIDYNLNLSDIMQGYSRLGIYNPNLKAKRLETEKKASTDWVNIGLFVMLVVVLFLFVLT